MNKFIIRLLCCFIPDKKLRHILRQCRIGGYRNIKNRVAIVYCGRKLPRFFRICGLSVLAGGRQNQIIIDSGARFFNCHILFRDARNCTFRIGKNSRMDNMAVHLSWGKNSVIEIAKDCTFYGGGMWVGEPNSRIEIGKNCLMANPVYLWGSDGHAIIDRGTNTVINTISKPLIIGDHCWLGQGVRVLKNAHIPNDTVVGGGSLVTKAFTESHTILAGNPARVVKTGIDWNHKNPYWMDLELKANKQ